MFSDVAAANRDGLSRKARMREIQAAMDTRSYQSMVHGLLDALDQGDEAERELQDSLVKIFSN